MAKSEVIRATCIVLGSSWGSEAPLASFCWCCFRLEGVIQPSSSSDSEAWTSSTASVGEDSGSWEGTGASSAVLGSWGSEVEICVSSSFSSMPCVCERPSAGALGSAGAGADSACTSVDAAAGSPFFSKPSAGAPVREAGGAPFTLFCPGTLRNLQSP